jgi:hypothetical protein
MRGEAYEGLEVGKELGLSPSGVSNAVRRGEAFLKSKPGLKEKIISELEK